VITCSVTRKIIDGLEDEFNVYDPPPCSDKSTERAGVIADYYEEIGDEALSRYWRYVAEHSRTMVAQCRKLPWTRPEIRVGDVYAWNLSDSYGGVSYLPSHIYKRLKSNNHSECGHSRWYSSLVEACEDLGRVLLEIDKESK
jgi:hypothetical protein